MPDFNEQLETIARLRGEARQHDEALYAARIGLQKFNQRRARAERRQTVAATDRDAEVARLRAEMAQLNASLAALRESERGVAKRLDEISEQESLLAHLKQNLTATGNRAQALRRKLADLQQQNPPQDEIDKLRAELEALERAQAQLEEAIRAASRRLEELRAHEQELRDKQEAVQGRMEGVRADLQGLQGQIIELQQPAFDDREAIDAGIAELNAVIDRSRRNSDRVTNELSSAVSGLYLAADPHPRVPLARLNDQTPFLLFPVRLETIFAGTELRVRIYPDEILAHTHEATLTDREVDAGELYWVELVVAAHLRSERERRQKAAWTHLVNLFGGQRAAWVARNTRPSDWDAWIAAGEKDTLLEFLGAADAGFLPALTALPLSQQVRTALTKAAAENDGDAFMRIAENESWGERINAVARTRILSFPVVELTKTDAWSRAPRTQALPDRFVLLLYRTADAAPREITGAIIPDTVFLGPDPFEPKTTFVKKDGAVTLGGDCDWMSDFEVAVGQGLGFRVPLSEEEANEGFSRVAVLGLRLSAGTAHGAEMLEELIGNHQFSPKGFSLVPQGTPTNNTERNGTGYSDNDPYGDLSFFTELDAPAFDAASADPLKSQTDGRALADALGIAYATLQSVQHADQTDVLEARTMNTALFPSTLGFWLKTWMSPVVTADAARLTRTFFTQYVTGRGPLPAVRVGNQPYGVLVTSDMSRWKYPAREGLQAQLALFDELTPFLARLHHILSKLEGNWNTLASDVAHVGSEGGDPSSMLMNMLGLHPTSVEFYQRIGFHEKYLRSLGSFMANPHYATELAILANAPASVRIFLRNLGVEETIGAVADTLAMHVLWQHYTDRLDVPNLVENKPPSEVNPLTFNYIDWLEKSESTGKIIAEQFNGPKPAALLYVMLRNALLLQLSHGTYDWLKGRSDFEPALDESLAGVGPMHGVRTSVPSVSRFELMAVSVEAVQAHHPAPGTSVADWIWRGPGAAEPEAAFAQEQRAALGLLANASTARLERSLIEHLDCCHYRLDAWETGLFAQRLQAQRRNGSAYLERRTGIYLGAFGWVEDVKRIVRTVLRKEDLPATLRPADERPVMEEDEVATAAPTPGGSKQGGYTHAPSLNHAAAAALLRNAYLGHSSSEQAGILSINLSSERVQRAQFVLEGMRNGQPIEALLGYQFERALHDRTSESAARNEIPVLELNQFIEPYRTAFPFESREIPQAGTGPAAETVPPYSVVNGLKLTAAVLNAANGFGLAAVLSAPQWPGANQGASIVAARDSLVEMLDAVKDLLMAENAYQLVQGNFDRVAAVSLAQKDARIPPSLEVLNTPRGTQFSFTNRVTLHFDDLDPAVAASNPWLPVRMTPRAMAEPGINFWLSTVLGGAPEKVSCEAWRLAKAADGTETREDEAFVTLADLQIQPIDLLALTGINVTTAQGATELETRVALHYRSTHAVAADEIVRINFAPVVGAGQQTFAQLFPLARRLRSLLGECRALGAQDFLPAAGGKATAVAVDKSNPSGWDVAELRSRVLAAFSALTELADSLDGPTAPKVDVTLLHEAGMAADDEPFAGPLGDAFTKLEEAGADFPDSAAVQVTFALKDAQDLNSTLRAVALFGISDALPPEGQFTDDAARRALLSRARRTARRLRRAKPRDGILDRADALIAAATPDKPVADQVSSLLQAGQIVFADTLKHVPAFVCYNEVDLAAADAARAQLLSHAVSSTPGLTGKDVTDEWLQGLARVRPRLHTWETVRTLADALNDAPVDMRPVQVPFRDQDSWLAVEFPDKDPLDPGKSFGISRDTLSITAHGAAAFQAGVQQRGLLVDEWTEEIPTARENTGISFRFNQPNAVPPQALLLAVTPDETGSWDWDDLVGTLKDTLARAKRRAVEPAQLEKDGLNWSALMPALVSQFSTLDTADVSLDLLLVAQYANLDHFYTALKKA